MRKFAFILVFVLGFCALMSCDTSQELSEEEPNNVYHDTYYSVGYSESSSLRITEVEDLVALIRETDSLAKATCIIPSLLVTKSIYKPRFYFSNKNDTLFYFADFSINDTSFEQAVDGGQYGAVATNMGIVLVLNTEVQVVDKQNIRFDCLNKEDASKIRHFDVYVDDECLASMRVYNRSGLSGNEIDEKVKQYFLDNLATAEEFVNIYDSEGFEYASEDNSNYKKDE